MTWTRKQFKAYFGEDPEDLFGPDWKSILEDFNEEPLGNNKQRESNE